MGKQGPIPSAWDDDWETQADSPSQEAEQSAKPKPQVILSKAERLAKHAESNQKLWESAEAPEPETLHFVAANNKLPLTSSFKPQLKVLSRRPLIAKRDPVTGLSQLTVDDEPDENIKPVPLSVEEMRAKQKKDLEEKQRKYDEARAKIFGESAPSSGRSSPGTVTPPRVDGRSRGAQARSRGRGGSGRGSDNKQYIETRRANNSIAGSSGRELYDPDHLPKPSGLLARQDGHATSSPSAKAQDLITPIRTPKGPDGSGRGGRGFTRRIAPSD